MTKRTFSSPIIGELWVEYLIIKLENSSFLLEISATIDWFWVFKRIETRGEERCRIKQFGEIKTLKSFSVSADFAEVDILEEADKSDEDALKFNLDWMVKVIYTIKPSEQQ